MFLAQYPGVNPIPSGIGLVNEFGNVTKLYADQLRAGATGTDLPLKLIANYDYIRLASFSCQGCSVAKRIDCEPPVTPNPPTPTPPTPPPPTTTPQPCPNCSNPALAHTFFADDVTFSHTTANMQNRNYSFLCI